MHLAAEQELPSNLMPGIHKAFNSLMKEVFKSKGKTLDVEILREPGTRSFIDAHTKALNVGLEQAPLSESMRTNMERYNTVFSGMKAFHEMNQAFPSMFDPGGNKKPFKDFLKDVQTIDDTYNKNYLRSEYNFVISAGRSAAKWESLQDDSGRYMLQYRTAGDDKVRDEHAALEGVTLSSESGFWSEFYPPNGWNCRCTVVQVRKSKYPQSNERHSIEAGAIATEGKNKMFRFNPGKKQQAFDDYNPYTISDCNTCVEKVKLKAQNPSSQLCQACAIVRDMAKEKP